MRANTVPAWFGVTWMDWMCWNDGGLAKLQIEDRNLVDHQIGAGSIFDYVLG